VKHDVSVLNENGAVVTRLTIPHTPEGLEQIENLRKQVDVQPGECLIGIETAHTLLVDFFWDHGYQQIYVLPPTKIKAERPKLHTSGAYTDQGDAFLIASLLRTQRESFILWQPEGLLIRQMRSIVSLVLHLTTEITRTSNRLTSVLKRYYPAALQVFSSLDTLIAQSFIQTYPTPQAAAQLTWEQFSAFARAHGHRQPRKLPGCYARLRQPQIPASTAVVAAYAREAEILSRLLEQQLRTKGQLLKELQVLFRQHPDHGVFASLPGAGEWLAPALLAKIGDDRQRFPQSEYLLGTAGTCPVTKVSGKRRQVVFRNACDHELRQIVTQWSRASMSQCGWAAEYFAQVLSRGHSENEGYRYLGNRWMKILWKLWQTHQVYDEAYHLQQIALRKQPKPGK